MKNTLVEMMSSFIDLTSEEKHGILEAFPIKSYAKETNLLREGQIAKDAFVVIKGCVRKHAIEDGEEKTFAFYTELQSAVNFESMSNGSPSKYYFTCTSSFTSSATMFTISEVSFNPSFRSLFIFQFPATIFFLMFFVF